MDIFLGLSGDRSRKTAEIFNEYLPKISDDFNPFISTEIDKGRNWFGEVENYLY